MNVENLIDRYVAGTISDSEMDELNAHLEQVPAARDELVDVLNLDSALSSIAAGWGLDEGEKIESFPSRCTTGIRALIAFGAAAVAVLALFFVFLVSAKNDVPFATVENGIGVEAFAKGDVLFNDEVVLAAGTLELRTARGAKVVIEAPAEFRWESEQKLYLMSGRLAADVPPAAKGFTVITPDGEAVDLGTKFGVDVPREGD